MPHSVTDVVCKCGVVQHMAGSKNGMIQYDAETNEYSLRGITSNGKAGSLVLYHCCFCGGLMPKSIRGDLFHRVDDDEEHRLLEIFSSLTTFDDTIKRFGKPDQDYDKGSMVKYPESRKSGPVHKYYRRMVYSGYSKTVEVHISEDDFGHLRISLQGKYKKSG